MDYVVLAVLAICLVLLFLVLVLIYQLIEGHGRMLLRLEAIEEWASQSGTEPDGVEDYIATLPAGVPAPPIDLPDLSGVMRSLAEWRGRRVLLVFFDPGCAFSRKLLSYLVSLDSDPVPGRPVPLLVSTGDSAVNRDLFDEAGYRHSVLLQTGTEVAAAYRVDGTPMSYLIDADGTMASEVATGVQATLILAGEMAAVADATETEQPRTPPSDGAVTIRDGIKEGTTAPVFRLPRLDGGEISLLDYRGRDVIVVFFDPECPPCDELAPELERLHRLHSEPAVVLVSRGEAEANKAMVQRLGLSLPVVLQRHWEISRQYGIFATPVAFHVDEWGVTVSGPAVGPDAILAVVIEAARTS